jgi:aspartyl-tRNA(Asn)/glutamyl-tRNA(Gln) amidotransferase subunit B
MGDYFEAAAQACGQPKLVSNWVMGELSRRLNADESLDIATVPVNAAQLAAMIARIADNTISNNAARKVFDDLWVTPAEGDAAAAVDAVIERLGLKQVSDIGAIEAMVDEVIAANPDNVAQYKAGKDKAFNALVGQVMKAAKGKANPQVVNSLLKQKLDA